MTNRKVHGRLVIIHHAKEKRIPRDWYLLNLLIPLWEKAGLKISEVFGTACRPEADVSFLHIDLSVIPQDYLNFARSYPVCINGGITDIRKSNLSRLRLKRDSTYEGQVIIKTALNYAGEPEVKYLSSPRKKLRNFLHDHLSSCFPFHFTSKADYRIYDSVKKVPEAVWRSSSLIAEQFRPERHEGKYCLREWYFFGNRNYHNVELSSDPVFTSGEKANHLDLPLPVELLVLREQLGFDYGKFDYTLVDGKAAVFDFNKTLGLNDPSSDIALDLSQELAKGIESYFK